MDRWFDKYDEHMTYRSCWSFHSGDRNAMTALSNACADSIDDARRNGTESDYDDRSRWFRFAMASEDNRFPD